MERWNYVVTYQSPNGARFRLCREHEAMHETAGTWPRDSHGEEYCQVSHGAHSGGCDECEGEAYADGTPLAPGHGLRR